MNGCTHAVLKWDDTICHVSKNDANVFIMHSPHGFSTSNKVLTGLSAPIPDDYFLPQCEPDSTSAISHDDETGTTNDESMLILPQGKMGSMTDAQSISYEHTDIGSESNRTLDHHLDPDHHDDHTQLQNDLQCKMAMSTPGNPQGTEYATTQTCTRVIRPPE